MMKENKSKTLSIAITNLLSNFESILQWMNDLHINYINFNSTVAQTLFKLYC